MESQPKNPEFRIDPESFHSCKFALEILFILTYDKLCISTYKALP